jgi:hypothetical protein
LKGLPITLSKDAQFIPSTDCKAGVRNLVFKSGGPSSDRRVEVSIEAKLLVLPCLSDDCPGRSSCDTGAYAWSFME